MEDFLLEAADICHRNRNDPAQGRCEVVLTTGQRIVGRIENASDGFVSFAEGEHNGTEPEYMLHVRIAHIVSFQYV